MAVRRQLRPGRGTALGLVVLGLLAGRPAHADAIDDLLGSLGDSAEKVRVAAAMALGKLGPAARFTLSVSELADASHAAAPDLVKLVHDGLARGLSRRPDLVAIAGGDRRVPALVDHLASDPSSLVRAACALALGKVEDPSAVGALQKAAEADGDGTVKKLASEALAKFDRAFLVDGSITVLKVSGAGSDGQLDCEVKVLIATIPQRSIKSWVTEDASIPGVSPNSASDVAGAKHDCLAALGDPLAQDIMTYLGSQ